MLRSAASRLVTISFRATSRSRHTGIPLSFQKTARPAVSAWVVQKRHYSAKEEESPDQFDLRWEAYFNDPQLDSWALKRGVNELYGHDLVPEPKIVVAMLKAARRVNDIAMAIRILEAVKDKAAGDATIYKYIIESVKPTLDELGISTPEELGLDKA